MFSTKKRFSMMTPTTPFFVTDSPSLRISSTLCRFVSCQTSVRYPPNPMTRISFTEFFPESSRQR